MNPYERRIIHMALQKDEKVFTRSEGNGTYKRVRVISSKDRHPLGAPNIQPFHIHRPIPQAQIDRTVGGYVQNCGYPGGPSCP